MSCLLCSGQRGFVVLVPESPNGRMYCLDIKKYICSFLAPKKNKLPVTCLSLVINVFLNWFSMVSFPLSNEF